MTTVSSGMLVLRLNSFYAELEFSFAPLGHVLDHYSTRWLALRAAFLRRFCGLTSPIPYLAGGLAPPLVPSNLSLLMKG
jgi:hypothetical protein